MPIKIPFYMDANGVHNISLFEERDDGSFVKTPSSPFQYFREDIKGISLPIGELTADSFTRQKKTWVTPTVKLYAGRTMSFYELARQKLKKNTIIVSSSNSSHGRQHKLYIYELVMKPSTSRGKISLFIKKYKSAIDLRDEDDVTPKKTGFRRFGGAQSVANQPIKKQAEFIIPDTFK